MADGPCWLAATAPVGVNEFETPEPLPSCCRSSFGGDGETASSVDGLFGAGGAATVVVGMGGVVATGAAVVGLVVELVADLAEHPASAKTIIRPIPPVIVLLLFIMYPYPPALSWLAAI